MAHFAEIDENNVVLRVVVVDNKDTSDANGIEKEHIGAAHLEKMLGGTWKQTSYNSTFRKNYAGMGYTYDQERDAFIAPKPYPSWVLAENTCHWESPVPIPNDGQMYVWDEDNMQWSVIV